MMTKTHRRSIRKPAKWQRNADRTVGLQEEEPLENTYDDIMDDMEFDNEHEACGITRATEGPTGPMRERTKVRERRDPAAPLSSPDFDYKATRAKKAHRALPPQLSHVLAYLLSLVPPGLLTRNRKLLTSMLAPDARRGKARGTPTSRIAPSVSMERYIAGAARVAELAKDVGQHLVTRKERAQLRDIKRDVYQAAPAQVERRTPGGMNARERRAHAREGRRAPKQAPVLIEPAPPVPVKAPLRPDPGATLYNPIGVMKELADKGYPTAVFTANKTSDSKDHNATFSCWIEQGNTTIGPVLARTKRDGQQYLSHLLILNSPYVPQAVRTACAARQAALSNPGWRGRPPSGSILADLHLPPAQLNGNNGEVTGENCRPCLNRGGTQTVNVAISARSRSRNSPPERTAPNAAPPRVAFDNTHKVKSQLNGSNGEVTGSDDTPKGAGSSKSNLNKQQLTAIVREVLRVEGRPANKGKKGQRKPGSAPKQRRPAAPAGSHTSHIIEMGAVSAYSVPSGTVHLPTAPSQDTVKATTDVQAYMVANADGEASAWIIPNLVNDRDALVVTAGNCTQAPGAAPVRDQTAQVGVNGFPSNAPMSYSTFTALHSGVRTVEGRVALVGYKVTAAGRTDDNAGTLYCYNRPANADASVTPWPKLTTDKRTYSNTLTHGQTVEHTLVPSEVSQCEMSLSSHPWASPPVNYWSYVASANTGGGAAAAYLRIAGATPGYRYLVEVRQHLEYVGGDIASMATPNAVVAGAYEAMHEVHDAVNRLHIAKPDHDRHDLAMAHSGEKVAAAGFGAAAAAGVPGAGLAAAGAKFLEGRKGTAMTKALLGLKRK